jgi:hypothetical protein
MQRSEHFVLLTRTRKTLSYIKILVTFYPATQTPPSLLTILKKIIVLSRCVPNVALGWLMTRSNREMNIDGNSLIYFTQEYL